jgi:hypothetical protein
MPGTISTNRAPVLTLWAVVVAQRIGLRWDVSLSLGIDSSSIAVVSGHGSPAKTVAVEGMDDEAIRQAFSPETPEKREMRNREQGLSVFRRRGR